ncbi:hypothetical protein [Cumulibacter soli]|uniref:hypothetical protein n=1 Tax=Cumulibacter soli TaxID=2546344 RepID=UPI00106877D9|nr:hypothetical protein [Cumulibacter soli]
MVEWRFCGRFSNLTQDAVPDPKYTWIDEDEARRRYHDPSAELTVVPPVDKAMGIVPYFIVVTTAKEPSFAVFEQIPPGLVVATGMWSNVGGRLFLKQVALEEWPPADEIISLTLAQPLSTTTFRNNQDGTGTMSIVERGSDDVTRAKREFDPEPLYRAVPEWGAWDELRQEPVTPEDGPLPAPMRQASLQQRIAEAVASEAPFDWERVVFVTGQLTGVRTATTTFTLSDGSELAEFPNEDAVALARELREAMAVDGGGTWFTMELRAERSGGVAAQFDFDGEPAFPSPVAPAMFRDDLERFPRDAVPAWLAAKVAEADRVDPGNSAGPRMNGPRPVAFASLPPAVQDFVRIVGREPDSLSAEAFVASSGDMAYRITGDGGRYTLQHPSILPLLEGRTLVADVSFEDACRVLVAALADRLPWIPGTLRYGFRGLNDEQKLARLRDVPLEVVTAAYLGTGEHLGKRDDVLDLLAEPAAVHLVDGEFIRLAAGWGWELLPTGGPDGVQFTARGDVDVALRFDGDGYSVDWRGERSNSFECLGTFADRESALEFLRQTIQ